MTSSNNTTATTRSAASSLYPIVQDIAEEDYKAAPCQQRVACSKLSSSWQEWSASLRSSGSSDSSKKHQQSAPPSLLCRTSSRNGVPPLVDSLSSESRMDGWYPANLNSTSFEDIYVLTRMVRSMRMLLQLFYVPHFLYI